MDECIHHLNILESPPPNLSTHTQGKAAKGGYNLGGFVGGGAGGGGSGERSRYLCVALEQGSRPAFATAGASKAAPAAAGEEGASTETFVVMYYFTVAPGPTDYQVIIKVRA